MIWLSRYKWLKEEQIIRGDTQIFMLFMPCTQLIHCDSNCQMTRNEQQANESIAVAAYLCLHSRWGVSNQPATFSTSPTRFPSSPPLLLHSLPFAYPVRMFRCFICRGCSPHPCYFLHSLPLQDFTKPKPEATRQCTHSTPQHTQHTLTWQLHSPGKL